MGKLLWTAIVMMLLVSGCGWNGTPTRKNDFTPLTSIAITSQYSTIALNTTTSLTVEGDFSGYFKDDVTGLANWEIAPGGTGQAVFNSAVPNRVKGTSPGTVNLKATVKGVSRTIQITVSAETISSIAVAAPPALIPKGKTHQFAAIGTFSDGSTQDITFDAAWSSTAPAIAKVSDLESSKGLATAEAASGTATITATFNSGGGASDVIGTADMGVTNPVVISISVSPNNPTVLSIASKQFTATGTYSDGNTANITTTAVWYSSSTSIATIVDSSGMATTLAPGTSTISVTKDGVKGETALTVTGGTLSSITVTPAAPELVKDTKTRITATGTFSNGSTRDITGVVAWEPADTGLATVTKSGGNLAWLTAVAGTTTGTTISAKVSGVTGITGTATLNVTTPSSPVVTSLAVTPIDPALLTGTSTPLVATATFSNGKTQDVTALSAWTTSDSSKVTVGTSDLAAGRVTGVASTSGSTLPTITATYGNKTDSTKITVTTAPVSSPSVAISCPAVSVGKQVSCTVMATYSGVTPIDVTRDATAWTVGSENTLAVADSINQPGDVIGVSGGSTTLSATFNGVTAPAVTITVTP